MLHKIPATVLELKKKFQESDFEMYLVGGSVRDLLYNRDIKDWDFTTNATPEQMQELFPDSFYDNSFGTVGIPLEIPGEEKKLVVEVTTYRTEKGYSDRRHPTEVSWGKTIEEDLSRRDFTINAMAMNIGFSGAELKYDLVDPFNGQDDLKNKLL